jgi:hypothetical protein
LLGEHAAAFERDVREALLAVDSSGVFRDAVTVDALFAWNGPHLPAPSPSRGRGGDDWIT